MNAQLKPLDTRPAFARESVADVQEGISSLVHEHYDEVTHHPDIPPGIDFDKFKRLESGGVLRIFSVRVAGELVGYAVFTVGFSMHYSSSLQSRQDTMFLSGAHRKGLTGYRFIKWCDEQLMAEGVECGYQHGKFVKNIESIFERMGYEPVYYVYMKRFKKR